MELILAWGSISNGKELMEAEGQKGDVHSLGTETGWGDGDGDR